MKKSDEMLYIKRKALSVKNIKSALKNLSLVIIILFILLFSLIFIKSMTESIVKVLLYLGSGHIEVYSSESLSEIPGFETYYVKTANSLAFSSSSSAALYIKAVDYSSYFSDERLDYLNLDEAPESGVVISKKMAETLDVAEGSRFTCLIYEEDKNRTRPVLLEVEKIFSSGYNEFDEAIMYAPFSLLSSEVKQEIILEDESLIDSAVEELAEKGIASYSYKEIYSSIYSNVSFSSSVLLVILTLLSALSAFYSFFITQRVLDSSKKDIALLFLSGMSKKKIRGLYLKIIMIELSISAASALLLALVFSFFIQPLLAFISSFDIAALDNYLMSFDIVYPVLDFSIIISSFLLVSFITIMITIKTYSRLDIQEMIKCE